MSEDAVWCNLVRNESKNDAKQPDWVAPPNENAPAGKKWTKGVKMSDGAWWNQAGWNQLDEEGNLIGINVKISPPNLNNDKPAAATTTKGFQSKSSYGNKPSYKF